MKIMTNLDWSVILRQIHRRDMKKQKQGWTGANFFPRFHFLIDFLRCQMLSGYARVQRAQAVSHHYKWNQSNWFSGSYKGKYFSQTRLRINYKLYNFLAYSWKKKPRSYHSDGDSVPFKFTLKWRQKITQNRSIKELKWCN